MFCVECGKEAPIFGEGLCVDCYLRVHAFSHGPKTLDVTACAHCGAYKYKNTWTSDPFDKFITRIIKNSYHISKLLNNVNISPRCTEKKELIDCHVIISGLLEEVKIIEEHDIHVRVKTSVCDVCSKRFGGYHEAIIQVRAAGRRLTDDELKYIPLTVRDLVEDMRAKGNRSLFITDIGKEYGGVDFYLSDSGSAFTISKKIQEQYGGKMKKSSKMIGMKDGRKIYRMTFLLRLPSYHEGEFVTIKDCIYYITSIRRNKVHVFELTTWTNEVVDSKTLQDGQVLGGKEILTEMIVVSETKNEVQVMNPETYEIIVIRKPKPIYFHSDKISTVKHDEQLFLFTEKFHNQ